MSSAFDQDRKGELLGILAKLVEDDYDDSFYNKALCRLRFFKDTYSSAYCEEMLQLIKEVDGLRS